MNLSLTTRGGRWGLQNPQARIDQLLAVITAADDLIASGRPEAARGLLVPFRGSGGAALNCRVGRGLAMHHLELPVEFERHHLPTNSFELRI